ncbi:MAG: hypothetical protein ABJH07_22220 [Sedimentitalea sp.]|uniref:hypothetical protein n=1 Tax=Sedimentitalea sp. TaxID=2048915 RepID=UPI0032650B19
MVPTEFAALTLENDEQIVFAAAARSFPTLWEIIVFVLFSPALAVLPALAVHYAFRRSVYVITTRRVLAIEPERVAGEMRLLDIVGFRGTRKALMIRSGSGCLWLSRLQDAWQFETIVKRVMKHNATARAET